MSTQKTTPENLTNTLNDVLQQYSKKVREIYGNCGREITEIAVQKLKQTSPRQNVRGGGKYAKSWAYREEKGILGSSTFIIYNKKHYRLTHLLEYGHVIRNGTRRTFGSTRKKPHIKSVEEWVIENLPKTIERELGGK